MREITLLLFLSLFLLATKAEEKYVLTSDSVSLYVNIKGHGPACLYIHGGPGSGSYWMEKFFGESLEQHFQMIYLDQRGVGRSSSPKDANYSMDRMAKDFEEVRKAVGIKKWLTLGHSFGGILQMGYVERYPQSIRGLMMINCTLSIDDSFRKSWIPKAYEFLSIENPAPVSGDSVALMKRFTEVAGLLREKGLVWKMAFPTSEMAKVMDDTYSEIPNWNNSFSSRAFTYDDYWKDYRSSTRDIRLPVLFFYGTKDWSIGTEHFKGIHFPKMILFGSNVGHIPFLENKADLEKAINGFVAKYNFR